MGELRALAIFTTYIGTCSGLTGLICSDLYKQYARHGSSRTASPLQTFSMLSAICLGITWYYMISFFSLSYKSWTFTHSGDGTSDFTVQIGLWLKDVQLFRDAWETATETPGRLFWSQPIFFITTIWSFYVGSQARSRRIPHAWAYMVLGQIVAISFAQNLFFVAVLLHPFLERDVNKSSANAAVPPSLHTRAYWVLKAILSSALLASVIWPVTILLSTTNGPSFLPVLAWTHFALLIPPIMASVSSPTTRSDWEIRQNRRLTAFTNAVTVLAAVILQIRVGATAMADLSPNRFLHRHSPFYSVSNLGAGYSSFGGISTLINSFTCHPAVSSVGSDVILSSVSYILWLVMSDGC